MSCNHQFMYRVFAGAAVVVLSSAAQAGSVLFVDDDAPAAGNGAGWDTAYRFLADALTAAAGGGINEIHVGQGTYQPDRDEANPAGTGDRDATFGLISGVTVTGGYLGLSAGKGKDPDERDVDAYPTVLSGDLALDDDPDPIGSDFLGYDENSRHVVTASGTDGVLDGFTVTAGNATGEIFPLLDTSGAGVINDAGTPTLNRCIITKNFAQQFAAGMGNFFSAHATITDCTFSQNLAGVDGGGVCNFNFSDPTFSGTTFSGNVARGDEVNSGVGGGMDNFEFCNPTITNCVFTDNTAVFGGGLFNSESSPTVIGCEFTENTASFGGGMASYVGSIPVVTACVFGGNMAENGGGLLNNNSHSELFACRIDANSAANRGGGMYNVNGSNPTVTNCTVASNAAVNSGGGVYALAGNLIVTNGIFWGNTDSGGMDMSAQIHAAGPSTVLYSCVQGGWPGTGNIGADPLFVDAVGADLHLLPGSPCIDAGDNTAVPAGVTTDLDGNARFLDDPYVTDTGCGLPPIVDMGAYELCLWDCGGDHDGNVGIVDFLALLAQWNQVGTTCDFGLGAAGVGINEFLDLLAHWGPCS